MRAIPLAGSLRAKFLRITKNLSLIKELPIPRLGAPPHKTLDKPAEMPRVLDSKQVLAQDTVLQGAAILGGDYARWRVDHCKGLGWSNGCSLKRDYLKPVVEKLDHRSGQMADAAGKEQARNSRRSERVLLQVAVIIGVKTPEGEISQDGYTLVVNAHGGLLETGMRVEAGREIFLANPRTGAREPCRVLHVRRSGDAYAVTFEFERRAAQFWPILFPPGDWAQEG